MTDDDEREIKNRPLIGLAGLLLIVVLVIYVIFSMLFFIKAPSPIGAHNLNLTEFISISLTAVAILIAVFGLAFAGFAFYGYNQLKIEIQLAARKEVSKGIKRKLAEGKSIQRAIASEVSGQLVELRKKPDEIPEDPNEADDDIIPDSNEKDEFLADDEFGDTAREP